MANECSICGEVASVPTDVILYVGLRTWKVYCLCEHHSEQLQQELEQRAEAKTLPPMPKYSKSRRIPPTEHAPQCRCGRCKVPTQSFSEALAKGRTQ